MLRKPGEIRAQEKLCAPGPTDVLHPLRLGMEALMAHSWGQHPAAGPAKDFSDHGIEHQTGANTTAVESGSQRHRPEGDVDNESRHLQAFPMSYFTDLLRRGKPANCCLVGQERGPEVQEVGSWKLDLAGERKKQLGS